MDYKKECQQALNAIEEHIRVFVQDRMRESFGDNWWKTNVPGPIVKKCGERLKKEQSQRFPILPVSEPIHYTNMGELKDVICRRDNFDQIFKRFFGNTESIAFKLGELIAFRNPAAHNRPILGLEQYEAIVVNCRSIFEAMEIARPPMFDSRGGRTYEPATDDHEVENLVEEDFVKRPECHNNLPRPDYSTFFGRDSERNKILGDLNHPRAWIIVIDGIGGVGKTALALNCAEHIRDAAFSGEADFEYVIWASAKTERLMPSGISQVQPTFADLSSLIKTIFDVTGFNDYESENEVALANEILAISKTLLVLDNLETVSDPDLYDFLQDIPRPSKVLATTRTRIEGSQKNLRLTALPRPDALEMIRQLASELDSLELSQAGDDTLSGLIERVGGIPLAIRLAVGRISTGLPLASYLDRLDTGAAQHDLLEFCFSESWNNLESESKSALLATELFSEPPSEVELRQVTEIPEMRLNDAIGTLIRRAFLNGSYDQDGETYRYSLLPLTADFVRQESERDSELKSRLQDNYNAYLLQKGRFEEALGQITHLVPQSQSIPEAERLSNMLVESAFRAYQGGNYSEAVNRLKNAQSYRDTAYLNHTWAVIERDEGAYSGARAKFRRSLELDETRLPTWRSWGKMEQRLENWKHAVDCFAKASELPGSDPQDSHGLGVCLSRIARGTSGTDRYELLKKAESALKRGFYKNPLGYRETHHNVVNCHSLALTLQRLDRIDEALIQCRNGLQLEPSNERLLDLNLSLNKR